VVKGSSSTVLHATDTEELELSEGRRNSWCSGEMHRYQEEPLLRRQLAADKLTLRHESVGIKQD
jgi:hypothetical protein